MADAGLSVEVRVGTDGLVKGLKIATSSVSDAAALMRASLAQVGEGAEGAKKKHEGFISTLREFKSEATQNSRVARFFANDLAAIIPGADGAGTALRSLIGIGLGGATVFSAIELGVFALERMKEKSEEAAVEAKKLNDAYTSVKQSASDALERVVQKIHPVTEVQEVWRAQVLKVRDANQQLEDKIKDIAIHAGAVTEGFKEWWNNGGSGKSFFGIETAKEQIASLQEQIRKNIEGLESEDPAKHKADLEVQKRLEHDAALAIANDREAIQVGLQDKLRQYSLIGASQEEEIAGQSAAEVARLRMELHKATRDTELKNEKEADATIKALNNAALEDKRKAIEREIQLVIWANNQKIEIARRAIAIQTADERSANVNRKYDEQAKVYAELADLDQREGARKLAADDRRLEAQLLAIQQEADREAVVLNEARQKNLLSEEQFQLRLRQLRKDTDKQQTDAWVKANNSFIENFSNPVASAATTLFNGLFQKQKQFGASIKSLFIGIADQIVNKLVVAGANALAGLTANLIAGEAVSKAAAVSVTQGHIAEAVAGAAASQAFIPFVGPFLAGAAASAMLGSLEGITAPLLSAAGGYDIPAGINPLVQTHAREMILPEEYADVIRGMAGGGGAGGDTYHVTIHALDSQSFDHALARNDSSIVKSIQRVRRAGRIP
jgi:hypothetical protein